MSWKTQIFLSARCNKSFQEGVSWELARLPSSGLGAGLEAEPGLADVTDGQYPETPDLGGILLLLMSFAIGQKPAVSLRAWIPGRNRGDRKSQTRGECSLFWVKCRGGSGGTSGGAEEQCRRSHLYKASGTPNTWILMLKLTTPKTIRSWFPKTSRALPKRGSGDDEPMTLLAEAEQSQWHAGPAAPSPTAAQMNAPSLPADGQTAPRLALDMQGEG